MNESLNAGGYQASGGQYADQQQILQAALPTVLGSAANLDIGAVIGNLVGGGVAGAVVTAIVGVIKNAVAPK